MEAKRLNALKDEVANQGYHAEDLDLLVHDAATEVASGVNNEGIDAQLKFLTDNGWTPEDILGRLRIAREEEEEGTTRQRR